MRRSAASLTRALDEQGVYLFARLSTRYPTVEVRVADVCLDVGTAVLLAGLTRALVATALTEARRGTPVAAAPQPGPDGAPPAGAAAVAAGPGQAGGVPHLAARPRDAPHRDDPGGPGLPGYGQIDQAESPCRISPPGRTAIHGDQVRIMIGNPLLASGLARHGTRGLRERARNVICSAHHHLLVAMPARRCHERQAGTFP